MKRWNKAAVIFIFLWIYATLTARAAGTTSAEFLELGGGARSAAMGEAAVSLADQGNALHWNPANLGLARTSSLSFMYGAYAEEINYQYLVLTQPTGSWGTFASSLQTLSAGTLRQTDNDGRDLGGFSPRDTAGTVGWGRYSGKGWLVGFSGKFIQSKIVRSASTWAMDSGVSFRANKFGFGGAVRNFGGKLKYDLETSHLPLSYHLGVSMHPARPWLIALETIFPKNEDAVLGAGTEWTKKLFGFSAALRGGYNTRTKDVPGSSGPSLGFGWMSQWLGIDYAWVPLGDLDQTHRISLTLLTGPALDNSNARRIDPANLSVNRIPRKERTVYLITPLVPSSSILARDLAQAVKPTQTMVFLVRD